MSLNAELAAAFEIPVLSAEQKIWFFRTKAGIFYHDFVLNNFIALGWDRLSPELIRDTSSSVEQKKERIADIYEEEKRPGLIYGQMDTFYNRMTDGDLVVIPSSGGKEIQIGVIHEFIDEVVHAVTGDDYQQCSFKHDRRVRWLKKVNTDQDIYLFKALRAQQTISDITNEAILVLRNLFPIYILGDEIHITMQKESKDAYNLASNVDFQTNLLEVFEQTSAMYGMQSIRKEITMKTAVGSPGFIEIIAPHIPVALIAIGTMAKFLIGKTTGSDGASETGILAIIEKINSLINDHHSRKKMDAETQKVAAETKKVEAEARLIGAQADKEVAETRLIEANAKKAEAEAKAQELQNIRFEQVELMGNGLTNVQYEEQQERLNVPTEDTLVSGVASLSRTLGEVSSAATEGGLSFNGERIDRAS